MGNLLLVCNQGAYSDELRGGLVTAAEHAPIEMALSRGNPNVSTVLCRHGVYRACRGRLSVVFEKQPLEVSTATRMGGGGLQKSVPPLGFAMPLAPTRKGIVCMSGGILWPIAPSAAGCSDFAGAWYAVQSPRPSHWFRRASCNNATSVLSARLRHCSTRSEIGPQLIWR